MRFWSQVVFFAVEGYRGYILDGFHQMHTASIRAMRDPENAVSSFEFVCQLNVRSASGEWQAELVEGVRRSNPGRLKLKAIGALVHTAGIHLLWQQKNNKMLP